MEGSRLLTVRRLAPQRVHEGLIPIARPQLGPEEEAAVLEVMRSGVLAQGERTRAFEQAFATTMGATHGVATCNGSAALYLALLAHGIGAGDEVITSPLTFIATANAIVHTGAVPVFADVDDTLNLDCSAVARLIGPRTKAIVLVHLHGNPGDLDSFVRLSEQRGLSLIQDACQAVGATVDGRPLGTFGTAVYSFYATKNITTGEGGMVITNDARVAESCASLRHQAYTGQPYVHDAAGYNFRMTEIQAAIGMVQLGKLASITERRRENAAFYDRSVSKWYSQPRVAPGNGHVYHQYTLRVPGGWSRDYVRQQLHESGVGTGVYYPVPVHLQPPYSSPQNSPCPVAEMAARDMVSVPVHPGLTSDDRVAVASALNRLAALELWSI
ncbi:MAG TPA: DegT/DnrJ/EryC1/StrS aminotransferase family protein [Candidatus Eisenbacteria bacterium]|nr:DegT/DnrJ/EryC1/StrS aminotransferase family protein [Candidatus Eisenbacteria bacterium]